MNRHCLIPAIFLMLSVTLSRTEPISTKKKLDALRFIQERLGVTENPYGNPTDEFESLETDKGDPCFLKSAAGNTKLKNRVQYLIPMADINPERIRVSPSEVSAKNRAIRNIAKHSVAFNTFSFERTIKRDLVDSGVGQPQINTSGVSISIAGDREDADRAAKAFAYLAKLCDAKPRPY